uniref:helix-turn-helix domain-containing protein n=1 Tax=Streptomyces scabiei TaxID=1930 RepID=UPI000E6A0649|nr:helix-turn-helix transcriptional regulator [Streptomyces scabiei]
MPSDAPTWITDQRRDLGVRLRDLRLDANYTQERFAELTGIDRRTLQRIERGESDPRFSQLLQIAATLHMDLAVLVTVPRPPATGEAGERG